MVERIKSLVGGLGIGGPRSEVMSFTGPEPCEDCGATPADDLVGVRWLCRSCSPAARRAERDTEARTADDPVPSGETPATL